MNGFAFLRIYNNKRAEISVDPNLFFRISAPIIRRFANENNSITDSGLALKRVLENAIILHEKEGGTIWSANEQIIRSFGK